MDRTDHFDSCMTPNASIRGHVVVKKDENSELIKINKLNTILVIHPMLKPQMKVENIDEHW